MDEHNGNSEKGSLPPDPSISVSLVRFNAALVELDEFLDVFSIDVAVPIEETAAQGL